MDACGCRSHILYYSGWDDYSFTLFLAGVKIIGPTKASLISCFEPLATIIFTVLFLGTVLLPIDYAGMACIMITVVMLAVKKKT